MTKLQRRQHKIGNQRRKKAILKAAKAYKFGSGKYLKEIAGGLIQNGRHS